MEGVGEPREAKDVVVLVKTVACGRTIRNEEEAFISLLMKSASFSE